MPIKEENKRVTITLSKEEINTLRVCADVLNIHYTNLIHKIIKMWINSKWEVADKK